MQRRAIETPMSGKVIPTIFNDRRLIAMLIAMIVCVIAMVSLLLTIRIYF